MSRSLKDPQNELQLGEDLRLELPPQHSLSASEKPLILHGKSPLGLYVKADDALHLLPWAVIWRVGEDRDP